MDEIDSKTCVLEPENPKRSDTKRRIVVGKHVSLQIVVNPLSPHAVPECRFLGADSAIQPLKYKLNVNLYHWNNKSSLLENLQKVLELTFPTKVAVESLDLKAECAICYMYKLEEDIPDIVCDGRGCEKVFHTDCLYKWFESNSTRQALGAVVGECPYCDTKMTVKKK
eukprot:TRINITY_DN5748_c0_g1_i1.p1 TRINITY_DN5748_c0_g1~~TRINITY_DN5748_c0_g1_i1.p1  ORF type:complete len:168 (-),score=26.14 TRINITY_DN5748_c0_g1_i1:123-626(-)